MNPFKIWEIGEPCLVYGKYRGEFLMENSEGLLVKLKDGRSLVVNRSDLKTTSYYLTNN